MKTDKTDMIKRHWQTVRDSYRDLWEDVHVTVMNSVTLDVRRQVHNQLWVDGTSLLEPLFQALKEQLR
jgi:hypothetical protein